MQNSLEEPDPPQLSVKRVEEGTEGLGEVLQFAKLEDGRGSGWWENDGGRKSLTRSTVDLKEIYGITGYSLKRTVLGEEWMLATKTSCVDTRG